MTDLEGEIWKDIKDWPFHQVSNKGRVRVLPGGVAWGSVITEAELRTLYSSKKGYMRVYRDGKTVKVHIVVLEHFVGPCPPGKQCRHLNGNPSDDRWPENLKWGTQQENEQDKIRHGTDNSRERNPSSKLTESDIIDIRKSDWSGRQLAIKYKVSPRTIQNILHGRTWNKG